MSNLEPIVVEESFSAPVERVWRAITDKDQMRQWFFEPIAAFAPVTGFATQFNLRHEGRDYVHLWQVTEVIPPHKLVYDWKYEGYPGASFVTWELTQTSDGTRLKLTHTGVESFPQDNPAFTRESCEGGWKHFLCVRLKDFLARTSS
jgi:uncharacterized protein YndB with AHSA1/START domain